MTTADALPGASENSVLREIILEHLFVGELLRRLWQMNVTDAEVLRSEFDAGGYDLVLSRGGLTRHIQLKVKSLNGRTARFTLGRRLAERPGGCVVCMVVTPELAMDHFLWLGGAPGAPLPDISAHPVARHTKGDSTGRKRARAMHRFVPISRFERVDTLDGLIERMLGPLGGD